MIYFGSSCLRDATRSHQQQTQVYSTASKRQPHQLVSIGVEECYLAAGAHTKVENHHDLLCGANFNDFELTQCLSLVGVGKLCKAKEQIKGLLIGRHYCARPTGTMPRLQVIDQFAPSTATFKACVNSPIPSFHIPTRTSPSNTWPRWPPHLVQVISVRFMP